MYSWVRCSGFMRYSLYKGVSGIQAGLSSWSRYSTRILLPDIFRCIRSIRNKLGFYAENQTIIIETGHVKWLLIFFSLTDCKLTKNMIMLKIWLPIQLNKKTDIKALNGFDSQRKQNSRKSRNTGTLTYHFAHTTALFNIILQYHIFIRFYYFILC